MKRYVADTHAVLWFCAGDLRRLGPAARRAFREQKSGTARVHVSVVSLWEVALLRDEGRIRLPAGFPAWCEALAAEAGLLVEPLVLGDVDAARGLPDLRDPHDRLIAGTSLRLVATLLSADSRFAEHKGVRVAW